MCGVAGEIKITVVPPWERALLYVSTSMPANYSPVDLYKPDFRKHQDFKSATPFDITIKTGDCLYLPAYWWYQTETSKDRGTTLVTFWYTISSEWVKVVFKGLEEGYI